MIFLLNELGLSCGDSISVCLLPLKVIFPVSMILVSADAREEQGIITIAKMIRVRNSVLICREVTNIIQLVEKNNEY